MRITTIVTVGTFVLLAGCDKAKDPVPADTPPAATEQAPAPAAPAAAPVAAPARQPELAPARAAAEAPAATYDDDRPVPQHPVYTDYRPPLAQPQPIAAPWAPPPLLGEAVPPQPSPEATWTGGYWVWREQWVWAPGHWSRPPRPDYHWVPPYYEHRNDRVLFVDGFWSAPGVSFVRPAVTLSLALAAVGVGVAIGRPPVGPEGPFVPPPPGSRWGLIVPAPVGTSPYVVRGAPPIVAPGMRVTNVNVNRVTNEVRNTTINRNTTVINNVTNVTIEAPASATANHQAVHAVVSPQSHLAAGLPAVAQSAREAPPAPPSKPTPPPQAPPPRPVHGTPGRGIEARPAESQVAPNEARRDAAPKPAPHVEAAAPPPRPVEPARTIERAKPRPEQRPFAAPPPHPPAPAKPVTAARPAPAHEARPAEPAHPPAHATAPPAKEHAAPVRGEPHEARAPAKDRSHEKPKDDKRD